MLWFSEDNFSTRQREPESEQSTGIPLRCDVKIRVLNSRSSWNLGEQGHREKDAVQKGVSRSQEEGCWGGPKKSTRMHMGRVRLLKA